MQPLDLMLFVIGPIGLIFGLTAAVLKWREDHPRRRHHGHAAE